MEQTAFHPGEHLQVELDELAMTPKAMAERLGVEEGRLVALLSCQRPMDADLALRLGHFFGISPKFWMNLQTHFDLESVERESGQEIAALPTLKAA